MGQSTSSTVATSSVSAVSVSAGEHIFQVSFQLTSGDVNCSGGLGGDRTSSFVLEQNEYISRVNYYQGLYLNAIQFVTNTDRVSDMYGHRPSDGGIPLVYHATLGTSIVGILRSDGYCPPIIGFKRHHLPQKMKINIDDTADDEEPVPVSLEFNARYELAEMLGKDSYSVIKAALDRRTNLKVAVKCIKRKTIPALAEGPIRQEAELLASIQHPNLVRSFGFFENERFFHHVFELCKGGNLLERMHEKGIFSEKDARALVTNLLNALKALHDRGIAHRDVKPENILFVLPDDDVSIKLSDLVSAAREGESNPLTHFCITHVYCAPEATKGQDFGAPADMWSVGVLAHLLLSGISPFLDRSSEEMFAKIRAAQYIFYGKYFANVSQPAQDFISKLLVAKLEQRMTVQQALEHPWIAYSHEKISRLFPELLAKRVQDYSSDESLVPDEYDYRYTKQHLLSMGTFFELDLAVENGSALVALKTIPRGTMTKLERAVTKQEVLVHRSLLHPNIVKFCGFWKDARNYYMATEWPAGGELYDRLLRKVVYSEKDARDLVFTLLQTVKHLHSLGLVHRDIRLENILLVSPDNDVDIKLAEFSSVGRDSGENQLTRAIGNNFFVAPEIVKDWRYGPAVDLWSVGAVTYSLLGGYPPFHDDDPREHFTKIVRVHYEFHSQYWTAVSDIAKDFISRLLTANPVDRLSADEALQHPWMLEESLGHEKHHLLDHLGHRGKFRAAGRAVMFANAVRHHLQQQYGHPDAAVEDATVRTTSVSCEGGVQNDDFSDDEGVGTATGDPPVLLGKYDNNDVLLPPSPPV